MVAGCLAVELSLRSPPPLMPPPLAVTHFQLSSYLHAQRDSDIR
jgi:hypothetical protein